MKPAATAAVAAVACIQPDCSGGTIDQDGYCDTCGKAPAPAANGSAPATPTRQTGPSTSTYSGTGSTRGSRPTRTSGRSSGSGLGAGLVEVPPVPPRDPAEAILANPQVAENRRFCGKCQEPVGRSRDGQPGRTEGFCRNCGHPFSFAPKLEPGELVAGQYEVLGCIAHGGLGWIYLAKDRDVSDRWVVLKGLLNTGDADAMAAAAAERQFLAQAEHPNIVKIYNFKKHASRRDGETAEYIVMEYVGGKTLKQIREEAGQRGGAVPLAHALAYAIGILPALGYLHDHGLVYCDFKPDNVIQVGDWLKLIDMGGVRVIDSDDPIYGTVGYQAPEIADDGPSPSSDLYTVGRALAVLTFEFRGYQGEYKFRLPDSVPLLAEQESYARLLRRATHIQADRRFQSAGEMAEQATGVLREVLSRADGEARPSFSRLFSPELRAVGTDLTPLRAANGGGAGAGGAGAGGVQVSPPPAAEVVAGLPAPLADGTDPAAGYLATLGGLPPEDQVASLLATIAGGGGAPQAVADSPETRLALVRSLITTGEHDAAVRHLGELAAADPADWRIAWYHGLSALAAADAAGAQAAFSAVYDELPGELAPKVALGFAAEAAGDMAAARRYYQLVWTVDRSYISAAFGAARACLAAGDRPAAIAAVAAVPDTSSHHAAAQIAAVRLLVAGETHVSESDVLDAGGRLHRLGLDDLRRQQLTVEILQAALELVADPQTIVQHTASRVIDCPMEERALRFGLERGYRALASLTPDPSRRVELVDMANHVRPRTWT